MNLIEFIPAADEKPLDRIVTDGGFCGIFRKIGCVGASLCSGEFEGTDADGNKTYHDFYDYSWGQYLARMAGCEVKNFSRGGMSAAVYCDSFAEENGFWNPELACHAYIIALGLNDLYGKKVEIGSLEDVCAEDYKKNGKTFAGRYAEIVQRLKEIQPDAKFFFMTMPHDIKYDNEYENGKQLGDAHARLIREFAEFFPNSYVLDFRKYGPVQDEEFKKKFYLGGHMNPCGYMLAAKVIASYIDYIIRHNMADFRQAGFIGTPYKNTVCSL